MFLRQAIARGCVPVATEFEDPHADTVNVATMIRKAQNRPRATRRAADDSIHRPTAPRASAVDSEAPARQATISERAADRILEADVVDRVVGKIALMLNRAGGDGISRTRIRDLHHRHESAERIEQALQLLERRGLARVEHLSTGGRRREVWYGAGESATEATEP